MTCKRSDLGPVTVWSCGRQVDHDPGDEDRRPDFEHGMRSPA